MNTLTTILGTVGGAITATSTVDQETKTINREKRNGTLGTTVSLSAITVAGEILSDRDMKRIYSEQSIADNNCAQAYIQSLSKEELYKSRELLQMLINEEEHAATKEENTCKIR